MPPNAQRLWSELASDDGVSAAPDTTTLITPPTMGDPPRNVASEPETISGEHPIGHVRAVELARFGVADEGRRYREGGVLGQGGMGEVRLCRDVRIERSVAMKRMHPELASRIGDRARFVREALAQAQLEHPAIVPVYDVGADPDGSLYFTMRRVEGKTLEQIVFGFQGARAGGEESSRHRLLSAFSRVCLAVDYAHARDVLHCDLKPANIMLGSFGEVYVLDWGLAERSTAVTVTNDELPKGGGTPGYMAPEQLRGETIDARADVYSLGVTLFEILTFERAHEGDTTDVIRQTLRGTMGRPSQRAPKRLIPPELDAICAKATALEPGDRHATARELGEAVERFLAGDRDLALRRELSRAHTESAVAAATRSRGGKRDAIASRSEALRAVGRALAFDPENHDAIRTLVDLLTDPPSCMPQEAEDALFAAERAFQRTRARAGALGFVCWLGLLPLFLHAGLATSWAVLANAATWLGLALVLLATAWKPQRDGRSSPWVPVLTAIPVAATSLIAGTFLASTFATVLSLGFTLAVRWRHRFVPLASGLVSVLVPWIASRLGWLPAMAPSIDARFADLILCAQLASVFVGWFFAMRLRAKLTEVQEREYLHMWQLRQLLPKVGERNR